MRPLLAAALLLVACAPAYEVPQGVGAQPAAAPVSTGAARSARDFRGVAARIEPVAETFCREEAPSAPRGYCDFAIVLETDPRMPPNAFQTRRADGRPIIVVSAKLLDQMRSNDEIAFVLAHEASHHIAEHLPKQQQSQVLGALILGGIVAAAGGSDTPQAQQAIRDAMDVGAFVGSRTYSQSFELEADWLGAFITSRAGYDPVRGAQVFARPALSAAGGPVLLSTHPPSPRRQALVAQADAEIRRQRAAGAVPRPAQSDGRLF